MQDINMHFYLHTFRKSPLRSQNTNFLELHIIDWLILRLWKTLLQTKLDTKVIVSKLEGVTVK